METVKLDNGEVLGIRIWRLFVYTDQPKYPSTRSGGCMVTWRGKQVCARHKFWRLCWVAGSSNA